MYTDMIELNEVRSELLGEETLKELYKDHAKGEGETYKQMITTNIRDFLMPDMKYTDSDSPDTVL